MQTDLKGISTTTTATTYVSNIKRLKTMTQSSVYDPAYTHRRKEIPKDEDRYHTNEPLSHIKRDEFKLPHKLNDELSFLPWYDDFQSSLENCPQFKPFVVLDLLLLEGSTFDYRENVRRAHEECLLNPLINQYLNQALFQSLDPNLEYLVFQDKTFSENFESIKFHFHQVMNPFFFMSLESSLKFDIANVLQFLKDLDNLIKVYQFTFQKPTPDELKLNWIMNCLNTLYPEISREIQLNWEAINRDPILIRRILTKHANSRLKIRKLAMSD